MIALRNIPQLCLSITLTLSFAESSFAQVSIRDTVVIGNVTTHSVILSVTERVTLTAYYTYKACGSSGTFELNGPCSSYHQFVTGPVSNDFVEQKATIVVVCNDPGNYTFNISQHINCPTGQLPCGFSSNCLEYISVYDDQDPPNSWNSGAGAAQSVTPPPIVVNQECAPEDLQQQQIVGDPIEPLTETSTFAWELSSGPQTVNLIGTCALVKPEDLRHGYTTLMNQIPFNGSGGTIYTRFDDLQIATCWTGLAGMEKWNFSIYNIRVPVFSSTCTDLIPGTYDLLDGSVASVLTQYIQTCSIYKQVMNNLKFYIDTEYEEGKEAPGPYYFSVGVAKHEESHLAYNRKVFIEDMNNLRFPVLNKFHEDKTEYPCAQDAINAVKPSILDQMFRSFDYTASLADEPAAFDDAKAEYIEIRKRITRWAKNQPWWGSNPQSITCTENP